MPDPRPELAERFRRDRSVLTAAFGSGRPLGRITGRRRVGDPHNGGRRVTILRFAAGVSIVYKPRPVAPERFWHRLTSWCNARAGRPLVLAPAVLDCGDYGWTRYLAPDAPCPRGRNRRAGRRAGALLALLDVFEVRDAHVDNIVVTAGCPVLVDAETIAHPRFAPFIASPSLALTGFLPVPGTADHHAGIRALGKATAGGFVTGVAAGYREVYDLLRRHRRQLLSPSGLLSELARLRTRVVLRPTRSYAEALTTGVWPPHDLPALPFAPAVRGAVRREERRALACGDIPAFHARVGGRALDPGGRVFAASAAATIRRRLERLSGAEREEMVELITGALRLDALRAR